MRRALMVSGGTVAGLVAVLSYSGGTAGPSLAASDSGLGAPPPATADDPSTAPPQGAASTSATSSTAPTPRASASKATVARAAGPTPGTTGSPTRPAAPSASSTPKPSPSSTASRPRSTSPTPTPRPTTASPTPTPTPTPTGPVDYLGAVKYHEHGAVQVGIRVQDGRIIAAWAAVYPTGSAQHYSDISIPVLTSETLQAQSAVIANVTGATLTSNAWKSSLKTALTKAGL